MSAEHFAQTSNQIKGKVTMIFITNQVPKGLINPAAKHPIERCIPGFYV
ncbi:MAG: hypothetical protein HZA65_00785 [Rhodocyclales bacterium]|nr:hypothetical protein [Rhodocyclales bacterium]